VIASWSIFFPTGDMIEKCQKKRQADDDLIEGAPCMKAPTAQMTAR